MRIYVERKPEYNSKAGKMLDEIKDYLKVKGIKDLRTITGYDIEGVSKEQLADSVYGIFAQNNIDIVSEEVDTSGADYHYATRYLDHQYDQAADVCATLLKLRYPETDPKVKTLEIILAYGDMGEEANKIKEYYLNPLEAREVTLSDQVNWNYGGNEPNAVATLKGFINFSREELEQLGEKYGIYMAPADMEFTREYFKKEGKDPTITELKILATYWSDHCRHSTFMTELESVKIEDSKYKAVLQEAEKRYTKAGELVYNGNRPLCLMDIATMEMKKLKKQGILTDLEKSDEVNACSIEATGEVDGKPEDFIIMFKNETHNHPTEIEPFGGAGTCIGGGIRDPLSGRAYTFGAMRLTGAADPRESYGDTMEGKLPQRKITTTAANGYSDYANQIGLASGYLDEYYDSGFKAKRMECGALVAYNYKKNITRANGVPGDIIVMIGGKTGRDGLGGATGSSQEQQEGAEAYSAEVQKGNPLAQRNIVRLFKNPAVSPMIKKSNDFGAGGVSVAIGEMAESLKINLDAVPLKYIGMDGTEVAISESQERMAVLLDKNDVANFIEEANKENLEAVVVAEVTDNNRIVMSYKGQTVCDLKSEFLNSGGVRQTADVVVTAPVLAEKTTAVSEQTWLENLKDINVASKKDIAAQFDKTVGGQSVFYPFGGKNIATAEQGLSMRLPLAKGHTDLGVVMTVGYNPKAGYESPFHAAYYSVIESVMKAVSMGAKAEKIRLSFQEFFESMSSSESWGKVYSAMMGAFLAQDVLGIPSIGGKDSMSGSYKDVDVPPTLISFAVAPVDTTKLVSKAFKQSGNKVYIIKTEINADGIPAEESLKKNIAILEKLICEGKVAASSVVGFGGLAAEVSKMCFGNGLGFKFSEDFSGDVFSPQYTDVIIESEQELELPVLGEVTSDGAITVGNVKIDTAEAFAANSKVLEGVFGEEVISPQAVKANSVKLMPQAKVNGGAKVLIPIFGGANGEYTLERQFEKAGADVATYVFRTRDMQTSFSELAKAIDNCNVLAIPSGMTGGAQPNASSNFITIVLKTPVIKTAVNNLIDRGGFVVGLGEGFKALVDTGMIENGQISTKTDSLEIVRNASNKHYSDLVIAEIINGETVFTAGETNGLVPLSTLDGRIVISDSDFEKYHANGQITTVITTATPIGSRYAIESMVSANGQIFGRLGDVSQLEEGLYANVFDAKTDSLFKNITEFFSK